MSIVILFGVALAEGSHLFPFRTEKLSPPAPMVLPGKPGGRVGRRPIFLRSPGPRRGIGASVFLPVSTEPDGALAEPGQVRAVGVPPRLRRARPARAAARGGRTTAS